ncbi:hypothetical protein Tco_0299160 [Tanacetum coccineum]
MEDEFYNLAVKGNDLKTYIRRFQELAVLCPNMVPNSEKLMEVFISGLPKSIEGNVTASKPQTLEEATNIAQSAQKQATGPQGNMLRDEFAFVRLRISTLETTLEDIQEEGHMARQCTKPKRPKNSAWFKEKMLLTEALESRATLDAEQLAFLADNGDTFTPAQAS